MISMIFTALKATIAILPATVTVPILPIAMAIPIAAPIIKAANDEARRNNHAAIWAHIGAAMSPAINMTSWATTVTCFCGSGGNKSARAECDENVFTHFSLQRNEISRFG